MKADQYGTPAEQRRFESNWRKAVDHSRCDSCSRCKNEFVKTKTDTYSCLYLGCSTQKTRTCNHFISKQFAGMTEINL